MKNLENYGVLEMDAKEIRDIDGGWLLAAIGLYLLYETLENPVSSYNAFVAGANGESLSSIYE